MASRRELQRLEDENRTLSQRLTDTEVELTRKEEELNSASVRKVEMLNDLREHQRRLKETKCQLDKMEMAEQVAQAEAREARQQLEKLEGSQRDQTASSKITVSNLQLEIKALSTKLADKTEQHEVVREKLHHNERLLAEMQGERSKTSREGSSRLANLNQALMKAKQSVSQLSEENVMLKSREQELVEQVESLERQLAKAAASVPQDGNGGTTGRPLPPSTPSKNRPHSCPRPATPARPVPGQTELETLQIENDKLRNELQCLQTNFQLMSQKSATVKREKKEIERSLTELQAEFDRILTEKENTEKKLEETRLTLCNKFSSMSTSQERQGELEQEMTSLQAELSEVVSHNNQLQEQLRAEEGRLEASEEFARQLKEKSKTLKEWKIQAEGEIEALNSHVRELEEELDNHRNSKASQSSRQRQESEAVSAYKQKLERVRGERRELEERLREASQALDEVHSKNTLLEKSNKALKRQLTGVDSIHQDLQEQREHSSGLSREVAELSDRLAAVTEENALLREECDRLEVEQKQTIDQIEGLTQSKQDQCERAESQEGVVRNLQNQLGKQQSDVSAATDAVMETEAQCVALTEQMEELQLELANVQSAKNHFEAEVGELVMKLEELEQANFDLSTKLSDAHNETALFVATSDEHSNKLEELRQNYQDMQTLLLEKEAQLSESLYTHKLLHSENVNLVSQVSTLSEMVAARNAKIESLLTEASCYESSTRDMMSQVVALEEEHGSCARQRQVLQEEIDRASFLAREAERRDRELKDEITSLRSRLRENGDQFESLQSSNRGLSQKLQAQVEKVDELVFSSRQSEVRNQELQRELREQESTITSVRGELEFLTKSSSDQQSSLRAEIESLNAKCGELRAKCEDHRETEVRMESEILHLQKQLDELQTVRAELMQDRQPLQNRYDDTRSELTKAQDELYQAQKELKSIKSELRYQRRKRGEAEDQLGGVQGETDNTLAQFELLREELLKVLDEGEENTPSVSRRKIKGIIKQSRKTILKPRHNIGE